MGMRIRVWIHRAARARLVAVRCPPPARCCALKVASGAADPVDVSDVQPRGLVRSTLLDGLDVTAGGGAGSAVDDADSRTAAHAPLPD